MTEDDFPGVGMTDTQFIAGEVETNAQVQKEEQGHSPQTYKQRAMIFGAVPK